MSCNLQIPVMNSMIDTREMREIFLKEFTNAGADRIYLCPERDLLCRESRDSELSLIKENIDFFRSHGFEVGVWIQAFGFGIPEAPSMAPVSKHCTKIRSVTNLTCGDAYCPEDRLFTEYYLRQVRELAGLNPDIILLDDDLCLSVRPGIGCFCDRHLSLLTNVWGRTVTGPDCIGHKPDTPTSEPAIRFDELYSLIFQGGANKYRDGWLRVVGNTLRDFCASVRRTIDSVNPSIRAGFCAGYTSFDLEGAGADELSLILAGKNTEPLLRLSGAPYWTVNHFNRFPDQRLHTVIEFVRAQELWCREYPIELFNEGDVYPRPRTVIPAAWLECYDGALRASGNIHSFKYMLDYTSAPGYETGYTKFHLRNLPLYRAIDEYFSDKAAVGVHVYEAQHKIRDTILPDRFIGEGCIMKTAFSPSAAFLTENGIPTAYDNRSDIGIAFGVCVNQIIPQMGTEKAPKKLILDLPAALLLQKAGFDLGIASAEELCRGIDITELFGDLTDDEYRRGFRRISLHKSDIGNIFDVKLNRDVSVVSRFDAGGRRLPASFTYNCQGTECLIFAFDGYTVSQSGGLFVSYERQRQLLDFCKGFPYIEGCPYLYSLVKRGKSEAAVFYANINDDAMFDFDIVLDKNYSGFEIFTPDGQPLSGIMTDGKIHIDSTLPAYGMFAVLLKD